MPSNRASIETGSGLDVAFFFVFFFETFKLELLVDLVSSVKRDADKSLNTCEAVE